MRNTRSNFLAAAALALAAGMPALGQQTAITPRANIPGERATFLRSNSRKPRRLTQDDVDRMDAAERKRERKGERMRRDWSGYRLAPHQL